MAILQNLVVASCSEAKKTENIAGQSTPKLFREPKSWTESEFTFLSVASGQRLYHYLKVVRGVRPARNHKHLHVDHRYVREDQLTYNYGRITVGIIKTDRQNMSCVKKKSSHCCQHFKSGGQEILY